jgi:hypothetical protein
VRRPEFIARQSARPSGILGRAIAWIMARETAADNAAARRLLEITPTDHVLELAYSGRVDHRFRSKPIGDSGISITSERSDAGCCLLG